MVTVKLEAQVAMSAPFRNKWLLSLVWLVLLVPLFFVAPNLAAQQSQPNNLFSKPVGVSQEQAAHMVRRESGGRVLSVKPSKGSDGGYHVRVLIDGKRVKQYYVDAEGRISSR